MILFLQALLSGIFAGGVYALVGAGLALVFGVLRVLNFAHGELVMLGMYVSWVLFAALGWDPYLSILVVAPLLFVWGAILQATVVQRALRTVPENQLLLTLGIGLVMSQGVVLGFGAGERRISTPLASARLDLGGLSIAYPPLLSFLAAVAATAALLLFLRRTDGGRAIRATAQDRLAAQLMGIDVRRVSALAFGVGAALAGIAGTLAATTQTIHPQVGVAFTLQALVIVVLGGMGSVVGAAAAGVLVGVGESLAAAYLTSGLGELAGYVLLLAVLLVKPSGLLEKRRG